MKGCSATSSPTCIPNAVKYSPAGGQVELRIERHGSNAILTVSDSGIGISEADARQFFQAFHRGGNVGQTPGSGLGLVIVKRCVELHREWIERSAIA